MPSTPLTLTLACVLFCAGCGPSITIQRATSLAPRAKDCSIDQVNHPIHDLVNGGRYHLIGNIVLQQRGAHEPFEPAHLDEVRSRACEMGGHAITVTNASTGSSLLFKGSSIVYAVLRDMEADAPPPSAAAR